MADNSTALVPEHLAKLWREGDRDRAVSFLRRALTPDLTVAEWIAAFNFDPIKPHIHSIHMEEIFRRAQPMHATPQSPSIVQQVRAQQKQDKQRRTRRPNHEMKEMKERLLVLVRAEPGTINTVQLAKELEKLRYANIDTVLVNNLMNELVKADQVICVGGKPKSYRVAAQKTTQHVPPTIIKKVEGARLS